MIQFMKSLLLLVIFIGLSVAAQTPSGGVPIGGYISPNSVGNTYPTQLTRYQKGGVHTWMTSTSQLTDTSAATGLPTARRESGMISIINGVSYKLGSDLVTWTVGNSVLTPFTFGAKGDGVTDDAASISNAMVAASAASVPLFFPKAEYASSAIAMTLTSSLVMNAETGATIVALSAGTLWDFTVEEIWIDFVTLIETNDVQLQTDIETTGSTTRVLQITTSTTHSVTNGDLVRLISMDPIPGGYSGGTGTRPRIAETFEIPIPFETTNKFTINQMPVYSYTTNPRLVKLNNSVRIIIDGLTFREVPENFIPSFTRNGYLRINGAVQPEYRNLTADGAFGRAFRLRACYHPLVDNLRGWNLQNTTDNGAGKFGYLIELASCYGGTFSQLYARNARHVFTTAPQDIPDASPNSTWRSYGGSMYPKVYDSFGNANSNTSFDTHEDAYGFIFENCTSVGNWDGNNSVGPGFSMRGSHGQLLNSSSYNDAVGLYLYSGFENTSSHMVVRGFRAYNSSAGMIRAQAQGSTNTTAIGPLLIEDSSFSMRTTSEQLTYGLRLDGITNVIFRRVNFDCENASSFLRATVGYAGQAYTGPIVFDNCDIRYRNPTNGYLMRCEAVSDLKFINTRLQIENIFGNFGAMTLLDNSVGNGTRLTLNDVYFDMSHNTNAPSAVYLQGTNASVHGENITIYTGSNSDAMGYFINASVGFTQTVSITNVVTDITRDLVDTDLDPNNVRLDYVNATGGTSRYLGPQAVDTTLRWPIEFVRFSATMSSNVALTLPKSSLYRAGKTITFVRESQQNFKLNIVPFSGDFINGLTVITIQVPSDTLVLESNGVDRWSIIGDRPRVTRYMTGGSVASEDYYVSVDASLAARQISLGDITSFRNAPMLFVRKIDSSSNPVEIWPFDATQTINGGTNLALTYGSPGVVLIKELTSTATNWVVAARAPLNNTFSNEQLLLARAMGSETIAFSGGKGFGDLDNNYTLLDGRVKFMAIWVPQRTLCTGATFFSTIQGSFTGDNFNGLALYTQSGGTMNQVAITANDENIWKNTANSYPKIPWTAPLYVEQGLYFIAALYNYSAEVTPPQVRSFASTSAGIVTTVDYANSLKISGYIDAALTPPASQVSSSTTADNAQPAFGLY